MVAKLLGEGDWLEIQMLAKLEKMAEQKRDAFAAALGPGKEDALIAFVRELKNSLESRKTHLNTDYRTMAKTISHINDILHLQRRYSRDGQAGQRLPVDIAQVIDDALAMNAGGFEKCHIEISRKISDHLPEISGDRTKLIRVFLNLFKNACEAFERTDTEEKRKVSVSAELKDDKIFVMICDTGIGFEPDSAESFFEAGSSSKNRDSGFGLARAREIIEAHGGTITLESDGIGTGARLLIGLPAMPVE